MKSITTLLAFLIPFALIAQQGSADSTQEAKPNVYYITETMPEFQGGLEGQARYLMTNVAYPEEAKEQGISGRTYVSYVVDVDGSVVDAEVVRSSHPILDKEALRVVKAMKYEAPGYQRGKAVRVKFTQPISFNLPKPVEADKPKRNKKKRKRNK